MDTLYPKLHERFKTEGICPVCLMEMELTPRYSCINDHTVCHRCKPYYYGCPTCSAPLEMQISPLQTDASQSIMLPQPMPRHHHDHSPSAPLAPAMETFLNHEIQAAWVPPVPSENHRLEPCSYSHLGCSILIPEHLRTLHESRCNFRQLREEYVSPDYHHDSLVGCSYFAAGCRVRMEPSQRVTHERNCIYKDRFQSVNDISDSLASTTISDNYYGGDPAELVQCKFRRYGCMVKMPRRRKYTHEQKCNYKSYQTDVDDRFFDYPSQPELDPDEQIECRWSEYGCRVKPKRCRKQIHENKCNYRMEECMWKHYGCSAIFLPTLRYSHESNCDFAQH